MATQATNRTATVEYISESDFEYGPSDSMQADSVLITGEKFGTFGGEAPRVGMMWSCSVQIYDVVAGAETGHDLSGYSGGITFDIWDPVVRTVDQVSFTYTADADQGANPGLGVVAMTTDPSPGMYRWAMVGSAQVAEYEHIASGWIEVRAELE